MQQLRKSLQSPPCETLHWIIKYLARDTNVEALYLVGRWSLPVPRASGKPSKWNELMLDICDVEFNFRGDRYTLPGNIRVVAGTLNKDMMEECTFESSLISIKPHPGYNFWTRANDIGLATVRFSYFSMLPFLLIYLRNLSNSSLRNQSNLIRTTSNQ